MSLFQLYETERKHFTIGKKWICTNPEEIGFVPAMQDTVVQIIDSSYGSYGSPVQSVMIEILTGRPYKGGKYRYRLETFKRCFKPYTTRRL